MCWSNHTSHIGNAEHSDWSCLDDTALVGQQRRCARLWQSARAVLKVAGVVVRSRLRQVSHLKGERRPLPAERYSTVACSEQRHGGDGGCSGDSQVSNGGRRTVAKQQERFLAKQGAGVFVEEMQNEAIAPAKENIFHCFLTSQRCQALTAPDSCAPHAFGDWSQ